ncbi:peptidoglycan DD-metalloendopeptidase family protein [Paraglaciecola sp. MB-3u-78]|uniref:peptidoglycan DD-metalloendopeptidase family protein n=1 Tax=Paraglaciecola sp. MB-3u-78 TaxID=2058332 RepID=UPI000C349EA4|nr:peptidoglycan DD-metalloendopeptidase family protein [Paraglaciecola sp. MB-3u-78]PKH00018.1 peptidase M23 [Paraglaciecola sp. MB-3u-78]
MTISNQKTAVSKNIFIIIGFLFYCLINTSCSNRSQPAPVSELYQGKTFRDFERQAYSAKTYPVKAGDTLYSIAWYSGNDYRDLARINKISSPYQIQPGQILTLVELPKSIPLKSNNATGQTSKIIINQSVDPSKKQAYGKSVQKTNKDPIGSATGQFPDRVKRWHWPSNKTVSRGFSAKEQGNKGLDFSGILGLPILAAADGKVVYTGDALRGFGRLVIIKHSDAYLTAYAHNDNMLVKEQQWVTAGQKIATMGRSGTDKVKLHFEVRYKGKSVNPLRYLPKR